MFMSSQELLDTHGNSIRGLMFDLHLSASGAISPEELFHFGVEGMLEAARRFDPMAGVQFWTFAYTRVRGAMIDAVRHAQPIPVGYHRRLAEAEAALRATAAGTPEHADAARRLAEVTELVGLLSGEVLAIARGEALGVDDGAARDASVPESYEEAHRVMRVDCALADEQLETARCAAAIRTAMGKLTVQERMIVRGLYFEERRLADIGADLGLSISWTSRVHTRALGRLKEMLERDWGYEAESDQPWSSSRDWIAVLLEGMDAEESEDAETTEVANAA